MPREDYEGDFPRVISRGNVPGQFSEKEMSESICPGGCLEGIQFFTGKCPGEIIRGGCPNYKSTVFTSSGYDLSHPG